MDDSAMKFALHFQANINNADQLEKLDVIEAALTECCREGLERFSFGNYVSLYGLTDKTGASIARAVALLTEYPAAYIGQL